MESQPQNPEFRISLENFRPCNNVCWVSQKMLKTEAKVFNISRYLVNINALKNNI